MNYITKTTSVTVLPEGEPLYSEMATEIKMTDDEGGWEFVEVVQSGRTDVGKICIAPEEWPAIRDAVDSMIKQCGGAK